MPTTPWEYRPAEEASKAPAAAEAAAAASKSFRRKITINYDLILLSRVIVKQYELSVIFDVGDRHTSSEISIYIPSATLFLSFSEFEFRRMFENIVIERLSVSVCI